MKTQIMKNISEEAKEIVKQDIQIVLDGLSEAFYDLEVMAKANEPSFLYYLDNLKKAFQSKVYEYDSKDVYISDMTLLEYMLMEVGRWAFDYLTKLVALRSGK